MAVDPHCLAKGMDERDTAGRQVGREKGIEGWNISFPERSGSKV